MRIDCYNACETEIAELEFGDTCYYLGTVWMKVNPYSLPVSSTGCAIVALNNGEMRIVDSSTSVILADTKVVANTKDTF